MKNSKLHALASAFVAYLIDQFGESIRGVYLFGSVARGEATKESDIDIFVDAIKDQSAINNAVDRFEATTAAKASRATGVKNPIRALAGDLRSNEFSDMRLSIAADGITLYGKALPTEKGRQPYLLIWFTAPQKQKIKVAFLRKIYGRTEKGKRYPGVVQKLAGFKAGSGTAVIPIRHKAEFLTELKRAKVKYSVKNIWL
jgi:predicted nucleotidyltransferase